MLTPWIQTNGAFSARICGRGHWRSQPVLPFLLITDQLSRER